MGGGWRGRGNYGLSTDLNGFPRGTKTAFKEEGGLFRALNRGVRWRRRADLIASPLSGVPAPATTINRSASQHRRCLARAWAITPSGGAVPHLRAICPQFEFVNCL